MALFKYGAAALAVASGVVSQQTSLTYQIAETYEPSNFFNDDKWTFFQSKFDGTPEEIDPTHGFVNYQGKQAAQNARLIRTERDHVYIGVDSTTRPSDINDGRKSVRIESKRLYDSGLFVADFLAFPKPVCGAWPAFWMYGPDWPHNGELDIYEGWNDATVNHVAGHTLHTSTSAAGACKISNSDFQGNLVTSNCNVTADAEGQWYNQGCSATEKSGLWGLRNGGRNPGGVYAVEWTDEFIKVWSWTKGNVPSGSNGPQGATPTPNQAWGTPQFQIVKSRCDIENAFNKMKLVFDITFCGDAAGQPDVWKGSCQAKTRQSSTGTCKDYVRDNASAFADTNWKIRGIKVYEKKPPADPNTSTTSTSTTASTTDTSTTASTTDTSATTSNTSTSTTGTSTTSTTSSTSTAHPTDPSDDDDDDWCDDEDDEPVPTGRPTKTGGDKPTKTGGDRPTKTGTKTGGPKPTGGQPGDDDEDCEEDNEHPTGKPPGGGHGPQPTGKPPGGGHGPQPTGKPPGGGHGPRPTGKPLTTSTVYATKTFTVSSCAPTVTNCPYGHVTTKVVAVSTTVCPVDEVEETPKPFPSKPIGGKPDGGKPDWDWEAPPAGGAPHWSKPAGGAPGAPVPTGQAPGGGAPPHGGAPNGDVPKGAPHGGAPGAPGPAPTWVTAHPVAPGAPQGTAPGAPKPTAPAGQKPVVTVNGGVKAGASVVAVMAGALMAMLL